MKTENLKIKPEGDKLSLQDGSKIRKELAEETMSYVVKRTNYYELRVTIGKDKNGKYQTESKRIHPPTGLSEAKLKKYLEKELQAFSDEIDANGRVTSRTSFKDAAIYWMENEGVNKLAPKTFERYYQLFKRVFDSPIGEMSLASITPQDLNNFYRSLAKPGENKHTGGCLSNKTIREHHNVISKVLEVFWKWGIIPENVAKRADPPSVKHTEIDIMDEDEVTFVLQSLQQEPEKYRVMITLLILFGFRKGELLGLEWKDINFKKHRISIKRNSQVAFGRIITKDPKTEKGIRDLSMDSYTETMLQEYRHWYLFQKEQAGKDWEDTDRLFVRDDGLPIHPDTLGDWWNDFQDRIGLNHHTLHSLRHTNASLMIANNTDLATVSRRLGHASISTTLNIYTHQFKIKDEEAANMLGNLARKATKKGEIKSISSYRI